MLQRITVSLVLCLLTVNVYAAGVPSRGGFSSSRSYSPAYRQPARTVVREYHTHIQTVHTPASSGGGIHPLTAGVMGYMLGSANHPMQATAGPPQVVYVNGQPQQQAVQQPPQAQQVDANPQQLPMQQSMNSTTPPSSEHSAIFWIGLTLLFCFGFGVTVHLLKKT